MRWLLIHPGPSWSVADVHNGWAEALRGLGEQVKEFESDVRLHWFSRQLTETGEMDEDGHPGVRPSLTRQQATTMAMAGAYEDLFLWWPDVVLCVSAFFVPPLMLEAARSRGLKIVLLFSESPYQDDFQLKMAQYADIALVNDPSNLAAYQDICPAEYMPHAYRPGVHYPPDPGSRPVYDLAFVGTGFPSRVRFFGQLDLGGLNVHLSGLWMDLPEESPLRDWADIDPEGCTDNDKTAAIYRQAATGINVYRQESEDTHAGEGWACGPREIEMAACGLWFCRDPRPESDDLFGMLPAFTSPAEASDQIRWALAHPEERAEAALKARAAVADRTFESNARRLLAMIGH